MILCFKCNHTCSETDLLVLQANVSKMPAVRNESDQENSGYVFRDDFNFLPFYYAFHARVSAISFSLKRESLREFYRATFALATHVCTSMPKGRLHQQVSRAT